MTVFPILLFLCECPFACAAIGMYNIIVIIIIIFLSIFSISANRRQGLTHCLLSDQIHHSQQVLRKVLINGVPMMCRANCDFFTRHYTSQIQNVDIRMVWVSRQTCLYQTYCQKKVQSQEWTFECSGMMELSMFIHGHCGGKKI